MPADTWKPVPQPPCTCPSCAPAPNGRKCTEDDPCVFCAPVDIPEHPIDLLYRNAATTDQVYGRSGA